MAISRKVILAAFIGALPLAGCATGPYYDNYGYERGYDPGYYGYGYDSGYVAPSVGLGYTYSDRDRRWRDNDGRWNDRGDRREWRDSRQSRAFDDAGKPLYDPNSNVYHGTGRDYDPKKDIGQYSGG